MIVALVSSWVMSGCKGETVPEWSAGTDSSNNRDGHIDVSNGDDGERETEGEEAPCVPGRAQRCNCDNGQIGVAVCNGDGLWGVCEGCTVTGCEPGETAKCPCVGGGEGTQTCLEDHVWGACEDCEEGCTPGTRRTCVCEDGSEGGAECSEIGDGFGPCLGCDAPAADDGGVDTVDMASSDALGSDAHSETESDSESVLNRDTATMSIGDDSDGTDADDTGDFEDSDRDTVLGECDYNACIGSVCDAETSCCEESFCGDVMFSREYGFGESYCYPVCDLDAEEMPCKCGDECIPFGDIAACLDTGDVTLRDLTLPTGADYDAAYVVEAKTVDYSATLGESDIPISYFYAYWVEYETSSNMSVRELVLRGDGLADNSRAWFFLVYIPEELFITAEPGIPIPLFDENEMNLNYFVEVYSATLDDNGEIADVWMESVIDDAVLTIENTCIPCTLMDVECESCTFSLDARLLEMRGKLREDAV